MPTCIKQVVIFLKPLDGTQLQCRSHHEELFRNVSPILVILNLATLPHHDPCLWQCEDADMHLYPGGARAVCRRRRLIRWPLGCHSRLHWNLRRESRGIRWLPPQNGTAQWSTFYLINGSIVLISTIKGYTRAFCRHWDPAPQNSKPSLVVKRTTRPLSLISRLLFKMKMASGVNTPLKLMTSTTLSDCKVRASQNRSSSTPIVAVTEITFDPDEMKNDC